MRKIVMLMFVMMMFSVMAVPAFAQTGAGAAGGTNWVAITSGFAIASPRDWRRKARAKPRRGLRSAGTQSRGPRRHSGGADSGPRVYRVAGVVHAGYYFRERCVSELWFC
jgi:hypothetical protein